MTTALTSASVKQRALALGFELAGVARAGRHPKLARLREWIDAGCAGEMHYLSRSLDERSDPAAVLPTVRSVVSLAVVYNTDHPHSTDADEPGRAAVARYAWGDDYHEVLRDRLRALVAWMATEAGPGFEAFSCVDTGPVQERVFAEQAGLGWIGKNTCLINPGLGSWLFLAEVLTNAELEPDAPGVDQCGTCTRCLEACPTGAIPEPYTVDATRCLSYLTIEVRGEIDAALRGELQGRVFGCDICQDVCPWNRRAATSDDPAWQPRDGFGAPRLLDLCRWSDEAWRAAIDGSAMTRAGLRRIRRSLAYAAAALPDDARAAALEALEAHPSAAGEPAASALRWARAASRRGC
jgi:epoxyqueuosine reductase